MWIPAALHAYFSLKTYSTLNADSIDSFALEAGRHGIHSIEIRAQPPAYRFGLYSLASDNTYHVELRGVSPSGIHIVHKQARVFSHDHSYDNWKEDTGKYVAQVEKQLNDDALLAKERLEKRSPSLIVRILK